MPKLVQFHSKCGIFFFSHVFSIHFKPCHHIIVYRHDHISIYYGMLVKQLLFQSFETVNRQWQHVECWIMWGWHGTTFHIHMCNRPWRHGPKQVDRVCGILSFSPFFPSCIDIIACMSCLYAMPWDTCPFRCLPSLCMSSNLWKTTKVYLR